MYRLVALKATNIAGFYSGLGRHTFEINLEDYLDKDVFCVIGDNGSGKSTFLNLISPWYRPIGDRSKFVIPGKEGCVIRKYLGTDGTEMVSKCIYRPKKDGNHTACCYLKMTKLGEDPIELNPSGNVSSYEALLYTYFGLTKEYLTFASYTSEIANIVKMTDTERKRNVGTLVPNTKRYEVAFDIVNDKYKELRNIIRNLSQKILAIRDEDSLVADMDRLTDELRRYTNDREDSIKTLAKYEGRLKELTEGKDVDKLIDQYNAMVASLSTYDTEIEKLFRKIMRLYDSLGVEPVRPDSINFADIDKVPMYIMHYEKKLAYSQSSVASNKDREAQLRDELHRTENEIMSTESAIYSIQTQDINALNETRNKYLAQIQAMEYTKDPDRYKDMSYTEIIAFSRTVSTIDAMIQALYDEYGQLVSDYFGSSDWNIFSSNARRDVEELQATIVTKTAKKDQLYRKIIEKEQYRKIASVLDQRPKNCTIDTCPFIANALKYEGVADEIAALTHDYKESCIELTDLAKEEDDMGKRIIIHEDAQKLVSFLSANWDLIQKYFGLTDISEVYSAIANGSWSAVLDIMHLKDLAVVLSEKDLYLKITMQLLPEVEHAIEMAKVYGTNRDLLQSKLDQANSHRALLRDTIAEIKMHLRISEEQQERYRRCRDAWKDVSDSIAEYRSLMASHLEAAEAAESQGNKIEKIKELLDKSKEQKAIIKELDDLIRVVDPKREKTKLDLDAVRRLKIEKAEVERDFIVIDVIRSIIAPGKGIRKELIGIYMYDICTIANQLLLNTFDGKLYLKEFIITDKEFVIPYVYNGSEGSDISYSSSAQQATISVAISLAILSKLVDRYGIYTGDEMDNTLNPKGKRGFINILTSQMKYVGLTQAFIVTQSPSYYQGYNTAFICFPGAEVDQKEDLIKI